MWNNVASDAIALKQTLMPLLRKYKIRRNLILNYNDRGRVENTSRVDIIEAAIIPGSTRINTNVDGKGRWVTSDYDIYCVIPNYFERGDLIETQYGVLKVQTLIDNREFGMMQGALVHTSTTHAQSQFDNSRYEPK